jgi:hypothetical protein
MLGKGGMGVVCQPLFRELELLTNEDTHPSHFG